MTFVLWVVVGVLAVVAAVRIFAWDRWQPFAILNDVTAFIYLPAWIVVAIAVVGRRYVLAVAAVAVVVLQIVLLAPELTAAEPLPGWARGAPTIRLLDANVSNQNPSMAGYAAQIRSFHPTLVTMEEATPNDVAQLQRAGALAGLPYRIEVRRFDQKAFLVASSYPLAGFRTIWFADQPFVVETSIVLPSGTYPLWVVHTSAPLPADFGAWKQQLALLGRAVRARGARGARGLLLVGDFNATWGSKGFRTILDTGMSDGAAVRGHAFDMTWSQIDHPLPPLVRIDHVLTGAGVTVTQIHTSPGAGSAHRDLQASVALDR